jgi:hypothetical protein
VILIKEYKNNSSYEMMKNGNVTATYLLENEEALTAT